MSIQNSSSYNIGPHRYLFQGGGYTDETIRAVTFDKDAFHKIFRVLPLIRGGKCHAFPKNEPFKFYMEEKMGYVFKLDVDGQLQYSINGINCGNIPKEDPSLIKVLYNGVSDPVYIDLEKDQEQLGGNYKAFLTLCRRCPYNYNLKKQILSALYDLSFHKQYFKGTFANQLPLNNFKDFLKILIKEKWVYSEKKNFLSRCVSVYFKGQKEKSAAQELLNEFHQTNINSSYGIAANKNNINNNMFNNIIHESCINNINNNNFINQNNINNYGNNFNNNYGNNNNQDLLGTLVGYGRIFYIYGTKIGNNFTYKSIRVSTKPNKSFKPDSTFSLDNHNICVKLDTKHYPPCMFTVIGNKSMYNSNFTWKSAQQQMISGSINNNLIKQNNMNNMNYNNYGNNFNNNNNYGNNNNQEVLLGSFCDFAEFKVFGKKCPNNQILYTRIQLPDGNFETPQMFQFNGHWYSFQATNPPKLFFWFDNDTYLSFTWKSAQQQMISGSINNNLIKQNNMNNYGNNYNNFNVKQPSNAGAVEQGKAGVYDEDAQLLMEVLTSGKGLKDAGFAIAPEDNGKQSISKNGKVLFIGKIEGNQLKEGTLNVKFTKKANSNKYVPTEYYEGKFKDNLFEDENGKYTFAERYNTGIPERYEGGFSRGTQHGKGTFFNAHELPSEYEYVNGSIISRGSFRDMMDTDVIVFDAAIMFQDAYTDRYGNNFHIVAQEVYDKKKKELFGKEKQKEIKMPTANEQPTPEQKKMMDFIQKHILVNFSGAQDYYIKDLCDDKNLIDIILNENKDDNVPTKNYSSTKLIHGLVREMKKEFFGNEDKPISELLKNDEGLKNKWMCFVVDKIGMQKFNKMYAMKNLDYFVNKISRQKDKTGQLRKLKVVFSNHGSSSLHLWQDHDYFSEEQMDKVMEKIKGLNRDTYVVNQSCYGGEKFDTKSLIENTLGVNDIKISNDTKHLIVSKKLKDNIEKIKNTYGKDLLNKFKQLMSFKEDISFFSGYHYTNNCENVSPKSNDNLKGAMDRLFGKKGSRTYNIIFNDTTTGKRIYLSVQRDPIIGVSHPNILMDRKANVVGADFLNNDDKGLYQQIFGNTNIETIANIGTKFHSFYKFLDDKVEKEGNRSHQDAEKEFVEQELKNKCIEIGVNYDDFKQFEKKFSELTEEKNKTFLEWKNKFNDKIDESIVNFFEKNNLLKPLENVKIDFEKKMIELADVDGTIDRSKINEITDNITKRLECAKNDVLGNIDNVLNKLQNQDYLSFIQSNFNSLYKFCKDNKDVLFENIFEENGILSKRNLINFFTKAKQKFITSIYNECNRIRTELPESIKKANTLKKKLGLLKKQGFKKQIIYAKNLSSKMVHYTNRMWSPDSQSYSNKEQYVMYHVIDRTGKCIPLVKNVEGFKEKLKEFEEELDKKQKIKKKGQNFGEAFHNADTINSVLDQKKFNELRKYIKEAKGNKNILLGYEQPTELKDRKLTVDVGKQQIVNNNNAYYGQNSLSNFPEGQWMQGLTDQLNSTYEKKPQDNMQLPEIGPEDTIKVNTIPEFTTHSGNSAEKSI